MVNQYMSSQEAEARSIYASNPTTAGYGGGSYSSQRYYEQQRQRDEERRQQQNYQDNRPAGYVGGTFNPATGETTGGHPAEATMEADRARSGMTQQQTQNMNMGYDEYRRSRPVEEAQGRFASSSQPKDYYDRPDIFKPDDPAQLNLMKQGYTPEQSAEMLRVDAAKRQDYAAERKYETLRQQADATTVSVSSGYHHWAKDTGIPQAPNPFEYAGDLALYAEKGYPRKESERFSPVDPTVLNLSEGRGGQDYVWLSNEQRNYDLRPAMDTIAQAKRSGTMGAYGQLGSPSSSKYGILSLEDQQDIARYVNENPTHQANGFRTNDEIANQRTDEIVNSWRGAYVSSVKPTFQSQAQAKKGYLTEQEMFAGATEQTVLRPSDTTLAYTNTWGAEKDRNPITSGLIFASQLLTGTTKEVTQTGKTQEVDRDRLNPSGGAMATFKYIDPNTNRPTDVMKFKEGGEYVGADGKIYQDYRVSDLSKVTITPQRTMVTEQKSGLERGWEEGNRLGSNFAYEKVGSAFGVTGEQARKAVSLSNVIAVEKANARPTVENIQTSFGSGMIKDTLDKPVEAGTIFALSYATGGSLKYIESAGVKVLPQVAAKSPVLAQTVRTGYKALPYGLGTIYAADATNRATEGFTDFRPGTVSNRAGGMAATEVIPMVAGFGGAEFTYRTARTSDIGYKAALQDKSTKGRFDYYVKEPATRRVTADYRQVKLEAMRQRPYSAEPAEPNPLTSEKTKLPEGYEPALGRNVKGEIQFGVRDYVSYKGRQAYANTGARAEIAKDMILNAPTEIGVRVSGKAKPVIQGIRETGASIRVKVGDIPGKVNVAYKSGMRTPEPEVMRSYTPYEGIEKTAYRGDNRDPFQFNKAAKPEVSPEYAPADAWQQARVKTDDTYFSQGTVQTTPEKFYMDLGEKAYGKPKTNMERLIKAEQFFDELPGRVATGKWDKFGAGGAGDVAPTITKGKPPAGGMGRVSGVTGTRIVGGRSTPALAKEPSLASLGKAERSTPGGGSVANGQSGGSFTIGQSTDFRQQPRSAMKPFTKQAAGQLPIMSEPLPMVEGMPTTRMSQSSRISTGMVSVLQPETVFMGTQATRQNNRSALAIAPMLGSRFGQQSEVRQAIGQRSGMETTQRLKEKGIGREIMPMRGVLPVRGITQGQGQKTRQDSLIGLTTISRQGSDSLTRQRTDQVQRQWTIQDKSQMFRQDQLITGERMPKGIAMPIPFALPGIGYGSGQGSLKVRSGRKHTEQFSTAFGTLSASMFSGSGFGGGEAAPKRKSVYGNYRGQFTTARGKTIRVKPMPKRMYE
jgi:hypothetical protein